MTLKGLSVDSGYSVSYGYDEKGCMNQVAWNMGGIDSVLANGSTTFTYDADGNMTSVSDATGYTIYVFDGENRLIEVRPASPNLGQKRVTMAYDFMGRRIKKDVYVWTADAGTGGTGTGTGSGDTSSGTGSDGTWTLDTARTFTWDGWLMTDETVTSSAPNSTPETTSYVWGLDLSQTLQDAGGVGGLLSMTSDGGTSFNSYIYDANGNVCQLSDSNIGLSNILYQYDFNGNIIYSNSYESKNLFKHSTKYCENETGLLYYGLRYYDYKQYRWLSRDVIEEAGGINLYSFIINNSINDIDIIGDVSLKDLVWSSVGRDWAKSIPPGGFPVGLSGARVQIIISGSGNFFYCCNSKSHKSELWFNVIVSAEPEVIWGYATPIKPWKGKNRDRNKRDYNGIKNKNRIKPIDRPAKGFKEREWHTDFAAVQPCPKRCVDMQLYVYVRGTIGIYYFGGQFNVQRTWNLFDDINKSSLDMSAHAASNVAGVSIEIGAGINGKITAPIGELK